MAESRVSKVRLLEYDYEGSTLNSGGCKPIYNVVWYSVRLSVASISPTSWIISAILTVPSILRSPKKQIWLRTALCGGWCRRMALCNRELHARNDDEHGVRWVDGRIAIVYTCITIFPTIAARPELEKSWAKSEHDQMKTKEWTCSWTALLVAGFNC